MTSPGLQNGRPFDLLHQPDADNDDQTANIAGQQQVSVLSRTTDFLAVALELLLSHCDTLLLAFSPFLFFMHWPCLKTHILPLNNLYPLQQWQFISVLDSQ